MDKPASLKPESPCIGQCSTTYGDDICRGCGRTFVEVVNWIAYGEEEKAAVWARLGAVPLQNPPNSAPGQPDDADRHSQQRAEYILKAAGNVPHEPAGDDQDGEDDRE